MCEKSCLEKIFTRAIHPLKAPMGWDKVNTQCGKEEKIHKKFSTFLHFFHGRGKKKRSEYAFECVSLHLW